MFLILNIYLFDFQFNLFGVTDTPSNQKQNNQLFCYTTRFQTTLPRLIEGVIKSATRIVKVKQCIILIDKG